MTMASALIMGVCMAEVGVSIQHDANHGAFSTSTWAGAFLVSAALHGVARQQPLCCFAIENCAFAGCSQHDHWNLGWRPAVRTVHGVAATEMSCCALTAGKFYGWAVVADIQAVQQHDQGTATPRSCIF